LVAAVRAGDVETLKQMKENGLSMSACNKFGESVIHLAARSGNTETFSFLLEAAETVYITDDQGRTVLHDACWRANANFDIIRLILNKDSTLLRLKDNRGWTPLAYVKQDHWASWDDFLHEVKDTYWPRN
ncbi:unnamed protein product, partial [Heterosigma akashiwo]